MRCSSLVISAVLFSLSSASCDLFDTRDPAYPDDLNQTLPQATDDLILMDNVRDAMLQGNIREYEKLFADTAVHSRQYVFIPSPAAAARYSAVFSSWDNTQEASYFNNAIVASENSSFQVALIQTPIFRYPSDSAAYTVEYTLFIPHNRTTITTQFTGRSEFFISPGKNGIWRIYRWIDYETKKDSSWSELKAYFAK